MEITLKGERITLLPQRAVYWQRAEAIIIADVHWGKTAHFRKNGIAIPANTHDEDAKNLTDIVNEYTPKRLIIAGDLFHSKHNNEVDSFAHWRDRFPNLTVELVEGNHDILAEEVYKRLGIITVKDRLELEPFTIIHDMPEQTTEGYYIHGHVHPAVKVSQGRMGVKLDCFAINHERLLLPAFGRFTGRHQLKPAEYKELYIIAEKEIIRWR